MNKTKKSAVVFGLAFIAMSFYQRCSEKESSSTPYPKTVAIEYVVTSRDIPMMNLTYTNEKGANILESSVVLPFNKKLTREVDYMDGAMLEFMVNDGTIDAKILVDGVVVEHETHGANSTTIKMVKVSHVFM
jgi:hypothetical protein